MKTSLFMVALLAVGVNSCENYQTPADLQTPDLLLGQGPALNPSFVSIIDGSETYDEPSLTIPPLKQQELEQSSISEIKRILDHPSVSLPKVDSDSDFRTLNVPVKCNFQAFTTAQQYLKSLKAAKEKLVVATETAQTAFASELVLGNDYHIGHPCNKRMIDDYILGLEAVQALNMKITNTNFLVVGIVGACASANAPVQQEVEQQAQAVAQTNQAWQGNNGAPTNQEEPASPQEYPQYPAQGGQDAPAKAQEVNPQEANNAINPNNPNYSNNNNPATMASNYPNGNGLPSDQNSFGQPAPAPAYMADQNGFPAPVANGNGFQGNGFGMPQEQSLPSSSVFLDPAASLALS